MWAIACQARALPCGPHLPGECGPQGSATYRQPLRWLPPLRCNRISVLIHLNVTDPQRREMDRLHIRKLD